MDSITVIEAKRLGVLTCTCQTTLRSTVRAMTQEDISALVVVDSDGYLDGIITRIDLLRAQNEVVNWMNEPVANWMSKEVVTVYPHDTLKFVANLLITKQIHRVVVVQDEGEHKRPLAVISTADLVYHMSRKTALEMAWEPE